MESINSHQSILVITASSSDVIIENSNSSQSKQVLKLPLPLNFHMTAYHQAVNLSKKSMNKDKSRIISQHDMTHDARKNELDLGKKLPSLYI